MSDARPCMHAAAELAGAGLTAEVGETHGVLGITAAVSRAADEGTEMTVGEDRRVQISGKNPGAATPVQIATTIVRALTVIATTRPLGRSP
jgi:hypothetical protein